MATYVLILLFINSAGSSMQAVPGYTTQAACTKAGQQYVAAGSARSFQCIHGPRASG